MSKLRKIESGLGSLPKPKIGSLVATNHRARGGGATARGYTYRWEQYRKGFLQQNPFCCYCYRKTPKVLTVATVVDHIVPHQGDQALFWLQTNHQPLCKACHDGEKAREERALGYR